MALHCYYQTFSALITILSIINVNLIQSASTPDACLNYCSGGGYCYKSNAGPKCVCSPRWSGERCNIPRDDTQINGTQQRGHPCTEVPADFCKNGGLCRVDGTKLGCFCDHSHTGEFCETPVISPCEGYCLNGGVCTPDGEEDATCDCSSTGWEGKRCQKAMTTTTTTVITTTTTSLTCSLLGPTYCNSGTCVVVSGKQQCQCPPTHAGIRCETPVGGGSSAGPATLPGQTPTVPTQPGQTPTVPTQPGQTPTVPGTLTTAMPPGVTCAQQPCRNGGRCFPNGNSYFCLCAAGFGGTNCDAQG